MAHSALTDHIDGKEFAVEVGNEESFVSYAENVIFKLQALWKEKEDMYFIPVLEACEMLEDKIYKAALKNTAPVPHDNVWMKKEAILWYQDKCRRVLKNLEFKDYEWKKVYNDTRKNPQQLMTVLISEDSQRYKRRKLGEGGPRGKAQAPRPGATVQPTRHEPIATQYDPHLAQPNPTMPTQPMSVTSTMPVHAAALEAPVPMPILMDESSRDFDMGLFDEDELKADIAPDKLNIAAWTEDSTKNNTRDSHTTFASNESADWKAAQAEMKQEKRRQREIEKASVVSASREFHAGGMADYSVHADSGMVAAGRGGGGGETEGEKERRLLREQREKERKAREQQEQTIDLDNEALREEMGDFMDL
jgi:hypothetical protein